MPEETKPEAPPAAPPTATTPGPTAGPAPGSPSDFLGSIFYGPEGVRSGWRLLVYLMLGSACSIVLFRLLGRGGAEEDHPAIATVFSDGLLFVCALIPALIMGVAERRSLAHYGLPWRKALGANFWKGMLWGVASLTILLLTIAALGGFSFGRLQLHGERIVVFALAWFAAYLAVALFEEFFLRGYTQFTLTSGLGFWPAAVVTSLAFGALHVGNKGESPVGAVAAACIGFFFVVTLRRTGDLWFAIGFHCAWDWGESYLFGVANSGIRSPGHLLSSTLNGPNWLTGGSVGPEGSLLVFVLIAGLILLFERTHSRAMYPLPDRPGTDPAPVNVKI